MIDGPRYLFFLAAVVARHAGAEGDPRPGGRQHHRHRHRSDRRPAEGRAHHRPLRHPDRRRQDRPTATSEGFFRLPGLQPGIFEVTASAPGLKSVVQKEIRVGVNAPAEVNVMMEAQTRRGGGEGHRAGADRQHHQRQGEGDVRRRLRRRPAPGQAHRLRRLHPRQRPGRRRRRRGSPAATGWRACAARNTNQNAILVEGFRMDWHKITLNSLAAMEVQTAGNGAENAGTPGAVVNMVTQVGLEPVRARRDRLARGRAPAPVHPEERRQQRPPPELLQPRHLRAHPQGQALVLSQRREPQRADQPRSRSHRRGAHAAAPLLLEHPRHAEADLAGHPAEQDPELHADQPRGLAQQPRGLRRRSRRPSSCRTGRTTSPASPGSRC